MDITYKNTISIEDYQALRSAVKWEKLVDEQAQEGLKGSCYIVSGYDNQKIISCARILWDGGHFAFLADVIVKPEYQHMGIGSNMIHMAIAFRNLNAEKTGKSKWC